MITSGFASPSLHTPRSALVEGTLCVSVVLPTCYVTLPWSSMEYLGIHLRMTQLHSLACCHSLILILRITIHSSSTFFVRSLLFNRYAYMSFTFCNSAVSGNTCLELSLFFTVYVFRRSHIHFSLAKLGCTVVFQVPLMLHYFC